MDLQEVGLMVKNLESIDSTECWFEDGMMVIVINFADGGYCEHTVDWDTIENHWSYIEAGA